MSHQQLYLPSPGDGRWWEAFEFKRYLTIISKYSHIKSIPTRQMKKYLGPGIEKIFRSFLQPSWEIFLLVLARIVVLFLSFLLFSARSSSSRCHQTSSFLLILSKRRWPTVCAVCLHFRAVVRYTNLPWWQQGRTTWAWGPNISVSLRVP